jgi:ribonuclease III
MEDTDTVDNLAALEALLMVTFNDRTLLKRAVTHHTCCPETAVRDSYDTLEFLGDAIISAHVVEYIYRALPEASEGEMTALKSEVVSRRILARVGQQLGLFPFICVDIANLRTFNERSRDSLCADVLEAVVGAIHIDQGTEVARAFVVRTVIPMIEQVSKQVIDTNPKGRLQKIILQRTGSLPHYRVLEQSGSQNDRVFLVGVFEHETLLGSGRASSIKEAGRFAAREALELLHKKDTY